MAKAKKIERILFFSEGAEMTAEETAEFESLGAGAVRRRADLVREGECPEAADSVAGAVPEAYAALYPTVGTVTPEKETSTSSPTPKATPASGNKTPPAWKPNA